MSGFPWVGLWRSSYRLGVKLSSFFYKILQVLIIRDRYERVALPVRTGVEEDRQA